MYSLEDWVRFGDELRRPLLIGPNLSKSTKLCIVGAGLSGLTIAYRIASKRPDLEIKILEATERCGGTIETWSEADEDTGDFVPGFLPQGIEPQSNQALVAHRQEKNSTILGLCTQNGTNTSDSFDSLIEEREKVRCSSLPIKTNCKCDDTRSCERSIKQCRC